MDGAGLVEGLAPAGQNMISKKLHHLSKHKTQQSDRRQGMIDAPNLSAKDGTVQGYALHEFAADRQVFPHLQAAEMG